MGRLQRLKKKMKKENRRIYEHKGKPSSVLNKYLDEMERAWCTFCKKNMYDCTCPQRSPWTGVWKHLLGGRNWLKKKGP